MATERANDLRALKGFIEEMLSYGGADLTLDQACVPWSGERSSSLCRPAPKTKRGVEVAVVPNVPIT
jgi:hypothetical protein